MSSEEKQPLLKPEVIPTLTLKQYAAQLQSDGHDIGGFRYISASDEELIEFWKEAHARACLESQDGLKSSWHWITSKAYRDEITMKYVRQLLNTRGKAQLQAYIARP